MMSRARLSPTIPLLATLAAMLIPAVSSSAPAGPHDAAWVDQRIGANQPTPEERRFDEIGWLTDLRSAEKLAKEHHRPIFLFTHDGRMGIGRD